MIKQIGTSISEVKTTTEAILDKFSTCMIIVDQLTLRVCFANKVFRRLFGYSPDELAEMRLTDILQIETLPEVKTALQNPPPDDPVKYHSIKGVTKQGTLLVFEAGIVAVSYDNASHSLISFENPRQDALLNLPDLRFREKDGSEVLALSHIAPLDPHDVGAGVILTALDNTDIKRLERLIKKNESIIKGIFDATPIGLGVISGDLMSKVNNAFCKMVGYSEQEIIGQEPTFLFLTESEFRRVQGDLIKQMRGKGVGMTESQHRRKDGRVIDVIVGISPLDANNVLAGQTLAVVDITEQKETEKEKARLEEMLLHAQKLQSIGRLAGGVAHDFNNVLTVIKGTAEMLMARLTPSSELFSELEVIQNAANSAANLTRQLLAFSRRQNIKPEVFSLNASLNNIRKIITPIIGESIQLEMIAGGDLQTIKADPGQIEQVILNLTVNARDAMSCGGKLTLETKNVYLDEAYAKTHLDVFPGLYAMLSVSDTGTGMSKDVIEHCFEPFFTTKESEKGTGLGLATVYGIVSQNGGVIDVFSEVGKGTVFKVYFPVSGNLSGAR